MAHSQTDRKMLLRATLISLALHLLIVPFLASTDAIRDVPGGSSAPGGATGNETTLVARLSFDRRVAVRARPPIRATVHPRASRTTRVPARPAIARSVGIPANKPPTVATEATEATLRVRGADKLRASEARLALTLATAPPEATPAARASESRPAPLASPREPVPASTPPPDATVAPAETPLAVAVVRAGDVAPGGWGQSFAKPLVADDDALATLRAKYRGMRGIAIDVDPSGHATRIDIPGGVSEDDREELMRALSAMRYVPAECNGLRCAGTMQLVL